LKTYHNKSSCAAITEEKIGSECAHHRSSFSQKIKCEQSDLRSISPEKQPRSL
jgi:hypothetical protein